MTTMDFTGLSMEQQLFCNMALMGSNIRVEACIGSGKTTAIQTLCNLFPTNKLILYLTYNKLLKTDARAKIKNFNVTVTNYHGFVYPYLLRNNIKCSISDAIRLFTQNRLSIPRYDILIIDEYQDIELDFAEMLEYVKSTNPNMQIIMVGDMAQKIYDKTTLDVVNWSQDFLGNHVELEFTQCFRLQPVHAARLGGIWNKNIIGVNYNCIVKEMGQNQIASYLSKHEPGEILCLGSKTGAMTYVLNELEEKYPNKFNKKTVYASIRDGDANIEPNDKTAIFTTFDSSKGMEKPICVVFDWDEAYWVTRARQPGADSDILRNIFCVAASRGKQEIIFVRKWQHGQAIDLLSDETLKTPFVSKELTDVYVHTMFDFKFVEEIDKAYKMLDIAKINSNQHNIDIENTDGLIDLSPCLSVYQKAIFFKKYSIDDDIDYAFSQTEFKNKPDLSNFSLEQKILYLVSLTTRQNRYQNQVRLPLVTPEQYMNLYNRLLEHLTNDEETQIEQSMLLRNITVHGKCDVLRDDSVWIVCYRPALRPEDFLQAAMNLILYNRNTSVLWNTYSNEIYKVSLDKNEQKAFLEQIYCIITKQKTQLAPKKQNKILPEKFDKGDKIEHPAFGKGIVTAVRTMPDYQILTIRFKCDTNPRRISTQYSHLTKL